jgi:pimeloyl-ACP methyl ester carboxylesterase
MTMASRLYRSEVGARLVEAEYDRLLASWPLRVDPSVVPTDLGDTFVIECGDKDAAPLVLLHGGGANSSMWLGDVASLARQFRIYAIDIPGEPGYSADARPPLQGAAYSIWLDEVLTALDLARPSMIGASFGGWIVLDYASRYPDRVDRSILLGPMGVGRVRPSFVLMLLAMYPFGAWGRHKTLQRIQGLASGSSAPPDQCLLGLIQKHFRSRKTPIPILSDDALRGLAAPVLAILGERDRVVDSYETERRIQRYARDARVLMIPGAGHRLVGTAEVALEFLQPPVPAQPQMESSLYE